MLSSIFVIVSGFFYSEDEYVQVLLSLVSMCIAVGDQVTKRGIWLLLPWFYSAAFVYIS